MAGSVKANRFNVKNAVYALITKDDATGVTHGVVKTLCAAMQVQLTPSYASGTLYGAGMKTEDITKITGATLKIDGNKVTIEDRAIIGGHLFANGVMSEQAGDEAPDIAVGYEVEQTGGYSEYIWLLKGKAKPYGSTVQQSTDNINFSTDSIDIGFVPRQFDGKIKEFGDTANSDFTSVAAAAFLLTVPGATLVTGV